jgi:hypothetical protein
MLQASTVLDLQQVTFFEQPATIVQHDRPRRSTPTIRTNLSLPCNDELWEISPVEKWAEMASSYESRSRSTRNVQSRSDAPLDYFQIQVSLSTDPTAPEEIYMSQTHLSGDSALRLTFNHHARELARNTPIRQLLTVSGESWIMGRKLENESQFQDAKRNLRTWVDSNMESRVAFWHATQLIRSRAEFNFSDTRDTGLAVSFYDTHMLHEPWVFYLAALVCWAYGCSSATTSGENSGQASGAASTTSEAASNISHSSALVSAHPALLDMHEAAYSMQDFLRQTEVASADDLLHVNTLVFGRTHGLLELIRLNKIGPLLGGLMNDAERVLYRVVEGRSRLSQF